MTTIPARIRQAWETRSDLMVLAASDGQGEPDAVYVNCVHPPGDDPIFIADSWFSGAEGLSWSRLPQGRPPVFSRRKV